jgi:hypothetical protein
MTQAFNLSQLANNVNSSGQLNLGSATGTAPASAQVQTSNFTITESGGKVVIKYGSTTIVSIDSSGNITTSANVTAYGTP